jgi:AcrR family transcriptional regulator
MASDDDLPPGLPTSLLAVWGKHEPAARGPKRALSLEAIAAAGVAVADREGLAAVSMKRVADELGSKPMSLYRYVGSKEELLALMIDLAGSVPPPPAPGETWRDGLERWARHYRGALHAHPWAVRVPINGPPMTPNQIRWLEDALASLSATALSGQEKLSVVLLLSGFVRNDASLEADIDEAAARAAVPVEQFMLGYGQLIRRLTDPAEFPHLHAAVATGALDDDDDLSVEFEFGLRRVLDGIEMLIQERSAGSTRSP